MAERVDVLAVMDADGHAVAIVIDSCSPGTLRQKQWAAHLEWHDEARAAVAELIEENKRLRAKADRWDGLIAARNQTAAEPDDTEWKRVAREESFLKGIAACRAAHGYSLREARECVEVYLASVRPGRVGGAK